MRYCCQLGVVGIWCFIFRGGVDNALDTDLLLSYNKYKNIRQKE